MPFQGGGRWLPGGDSLADGGTVTGDIIFNNNIKAIWGTDSDYSIKWDGTDLIVGRDGGAGKVKIGGVMETTFNLVVGTSFAAGGNGTFTDDNNVTVSVVQTDNDSVSNHAKLKLSVGGTSSGDAFSVYQISGGVTWSSGVLNTGSDEYVISESGTLGTNTRFSIAVGGAASFSGTLGITGILTAAIANFSGNVTVTSQVGSALPSTLTPAGTTQTIDWDDGNAQVLDLGSATGDVTLTLSNPISGFSYQLKIIQGGTARDVVLPTAVKLSDGTTAPHTLDPNTTDNSISLLTLTYYGDSSTYVASFNAGEFK